MEEENNVGLTDPNMRVTGEMAWLMVLGLFNIPMEISMKVSSKMVKLMDLVLISMLTARNIMVSGKMICKTVAEEKSSKMDQFI